MKIKKWILTSTGFYITATVCMAVIVTIVNLIFWGFNISVGENVKAVWLNIHASIVEVFLLGLFITKFNDFTKKQRDIEGWHEEIDDYRDWKEPEASYRIRGLIKRLNKAKINDIDLSYCFLIEANLSWANLAGSNMVRANLKETNLNHANLIGSNLEGAFMNNSDLSDANLHKANLSGANLEYAILHCAILTESDLSLANLYKANLASVDLSKSDLNHTVLRESNIVGAYLRGTILCGADLSFANLLESDLSGANLERADLNGAILYGANLTGVNFSWTDIRNVNLHQTIVTENWFEYLKTRNIIGIDEIEKKYFISSEKDDGITVYRLRERESHNGNE